LVYQLKILLEIGKAIGQKIESIDFEECKGWKKNFVFAQKEHGGGFGRLLFAVGVLYFLYLKGFLVGIPTWVLVLIALGFTLMRF
jgi:hypothetical protein